MSRVRNAAALALAASLSVAGVASAGREDGGTRSPFADGAGSRARAMGGAFSAIGTDASALTWNPAGLALATRSGFEVVHSDRPSIDARDDYAALVVPSWKWGALALSVRSLGAGGIEPRDDRNAVTGGDFSGSDTEIAVGYARALDDAWSVGASLKLERQSLQGLGATALAGDLGVLVALGPALGGRAPWLAPFSLGLGVRNALEPALRLDREAVTDPRVWRTGLAWSGTIGSRGLRLALDTDASASVAPRLHAGAELRLHPLLALRAGLDQDRLTAGAGVRWRELEIGYAFEDIPLGPVHRVGLSQSFGATVSQSRQAARDAEQRAFQARLDETFQRRQSERTEALIAEAAAALERGDAGHALERLAAAATFDSTDARIAGLGARVQREIGAGLEASGDFAGAAVAYGRALAIRPDDALAAEGARRSRAASERRLAQSAERRERFRAALDALVAGDLPRARTAFAALSAEDPADLESAAMLRRTGEAITRRAEELMREARRLVDSQSPDEARRLLARVRALEPPAAGLEELEAALDRGPLPARAAPAGPQSGAPAAAADPREAERMVKRGAAAMAAGRVDDALRYWELAWSLDPGQRNASRYLNREYLARGMDAYAAGRLDEAITYWEKARRADPADPRAAGFLARARERNERTREIFGGTAGKSGKP